uniref:Uncharacterized protein n=1 Tax=Arundo donax TaxID=35708 RepID=A0A0A8ZGV1_ARUDO
MSGWMGRLDRSKEHLETTTILLAEEKETKRNARIPASCCYVG